MVSTIAGDCLRCGTKSVSFTILANSFFYRQGYQRSEQLSEVFCCCPECKLSSVMVVGKASLNQTGNHAHDTGRARLLQEIWAEPNRFVAANCSVTEFCKFKGFVSIKDEAGRPVPQYLPEKIHQAFVEANSCLAIGCFNAAGVMYRTALDLATKSLLPPAGELSSHIRRNLSPRLIWLFDKALLPADIRRLADCVKEEGNDGAHDATLSQHDAEDLYDFTFELMRRLYTEPKRIEMAEDRRQARRNTGGS